MATTTALNLDKALLQSIGEWRQEVLTTPLTTSKVAVSTNFLKYTGNDDYFNDFWLYVDDYNNLGQSRKISDYTAAGSCTVLGDNFVAETGTDYATVRISRFPWADRLLALNEAIDAVYPNIYKTVDDRNLVCGNHLPNSHFEDWSATTVPDLYTLSATCTSTEDTSTYRGQRGSSSMKVAVTAADKYVYITSTTYPRLLDLMGHTVNFRAWAYPEEADDAFLTIYTLQADGTAQTLNSTTTCPAGAWTLLELNDQTLNDDLVEIQFRFRVHTNAKYAYFDNARVMGRNLYEYLLPKDLWTGAIEKVYLQRSGQQDYACDDLMPLNWDRIDHEITDDGTYRYLKLREILPEAQIRITGNCPLSTLSSGTSTIEISGKQHLDLLIAYAAHRLYAMAGSGVSSEDKGRYDYESAKAMARYMSLKHNRMPQRARNLILPNIG